MKIQKKKAQEQVRVLRLKNNDTVIVLKWPGMKKEDREEISNQLRKKSRYLSGITLIFLNKFSDLRTLNEEQMKASGWVRENK